MCPVSLISSYSSSDRVLLLLRNEPDTIYRFVFSSEESTLPTQWGIADSSIICCALTCYYSLIIYPEAPSFALFNFWADQFHLPGHSIFAVLIGQLFHQLILAWRHDANPFLVCSGISTREIYLSFSLSLSFIIVHKVSTSQRPLKANLIGLEDLVSLTFF